MAKATKAMAQALGGKKAPAKSSGSAPLTRVSVSDGKTERTVSVEKISNGYLMRESSYGPKGDYKSTTTFSAKPPVLDVKPAKSGK